MFYENQSTVGFLASSQNYNNSHTLFLVAFLLILYFFCCFWWTCGRLFWVGNARQSAAQSSASFFIVIHKFLELISREALQHFLHLPHVKAFQSFPLARFLHRPLDLDLPVRFL